MNESHTYSSRFGFHPCSYETFRQLKFLHKVYWQTIYDFHRWHRWWRKQPENRRGPEPRVGALFVLNQPWYKPVRVRGVAGFKVYPRTVVDHGAVALYQAARHPQQAEVASFDSATLERIAKLYSQAQHYIQAKEQPGE